MRKGILFAASRRRIFHLLLLMLAASTVVSAQKGRIVSEVLKSDLLVDTATGEDPNRSVAVYLPPSYDSSPQRRYPVLYLLHGIADTEKTWLRSWNDENTGYEGLPAVMDRGIERGKFGEFIVVMPDQRTKWFGSFYVNSTATGNWADFTAKDLVSFIDNKYRTIPDSENRAIAGHSMGGYGAITLGMKYPDVFTTVYGMNPAIIDWGGDLTIEQPGFRTVIEAKSPEELLQSRSVFVLGAITVCQAFSPNPSKPPYFCDHPFKIVDGRLVPSEPGFSKWAENSPIRMVPKYRENLSKLNALKFDSGYEDEFRFIPVNSRLLSLALTNNGIDHVFEEYNGDHRNRLWGRHGRIVNEVLPFVWDHIAPDAP
ncbi:MAG: esterase family protein [Acidobacteria bacterium]|nr:MAG: esterase family protein [Acidobacteriota bacterium]REJ97966.1 MAG: esterase family protein [Acidobacteriota bacterium]REK16709.1 MAG: esterase family protein [Acidobacteriota bacterium]REK42620.1 MAG: esterase family protein [Acidobacteriota bacterium]